MCLFLITRHTHYLRRSFPIRLPVRRRGCVHAVRNIRLPPSKTSTLQPFPDSSAALRCKKPCAGPKIVLLFRGQLSQDSTRVASSCCKLQALSVQQIELRRLHVPRSLTWNARDVVGVVLEIIGFESHGADYGGCFARCGDAVRLEGLINKGRGLVCGLAFFREGSTVAGIGFWGDCEEGAGRAL